MDHDTGRLIWARPGHDEPTLVAFFELLGADRCRATDALDEVRRQTWNAARRSGQVRDAQQLERARYALWKAPENLTARQRGHLAQIQRTNRYLYRAYLLKEQLREVFHHRGRALALLTIGAWSRSALLLQRPRRSRGRGAGTSPWL